MALTFPKEPQKLFHTVTPSKFVYRDNRLLAPVLAPVPRYIYIHIYTSVVAAAAATGAAAAATGAAAIQKEHVEQ